jgi:hypothetical protein
MIDLSTSLSHAIQEARRIRRDLVRTHGRILSGRCARASLLLADALGSPASLRGSSDGCKDPCMPHVWNEIDGVIIDITATQFNGYYTRDREPNVPVFGVLVTRKPREYHRPILYRGRKVLDYIFADLGQLGEQGRQKLRAAAEALR